MFDRKLPLSREAYHIIEERVVTLAYKPGSVMTERELVEDLGLGRTPVREAIQRLSWQGLMEVRPRSGIKITTIAPEDYLRIMVARLPLEPIYAALVAKSLPRTMAPLVAECEAAMRDCIETGDNEAFLRADKVFDELLSQACPNKFLGQVLEPLQIHARRCWFEYGSQAGPQHSASLHANVINAVGRRNEDDAREAMQALMVHLQEQAEVAAGVRPR